MIYYFCYDNNRPTGGCKIAYRHVRILNEIGISSSIVHKSSSFRYPSFPSVPIVGISDLQLLRDDVLVLPEDLGPALNNAAKGTRKIIFNQNAYYSFRGYDLNSGLMPPYLESEYIATLVVSEDNRQYLKKLFPGAEPFRLHISFDQQLFGFVKPRLKKPQFCFMTRKNSADVLQVVSALRSRPLLSEWAFKAIEGLDEIGVARVMGESAIYLAFGHPEGISLSNLEAMSSGCLVVGYSGMGCREFFDAKFCQEIPFGDIAAFVTAAEEAAGCFENRLAEYEVRTKSSSEYVRSVFSNAQERKDLIEFYSSLGFVATSW